MRAVVLVGGFGTRLRPLTCDRPKQMLPIVNQAMVEHVVGHLAAHGVDDVVLSLGFRPDAFRDAYPDGRCAGARLHYAIEPEPLDTGGAIAFADAYEDLVVVQDTGAMVSVIEAPTGRLRWNIQVAETNTRFLGNTRHGDSLFVTNETELFEFDMRTGNTLARHGVHDIATTRPVFFDHRAVFATAAGRLVCLDTRRDLRLWEYQFQGQINTTPLKIDDERVTGISTLGDVRTLTVDDARTVSSARIAGGPDG